MAKEDYILKQTGEQVQKAIDDALALAPATVETPGLMSASDKTKLNSLPTGESLESSLDGKVEKVPGKGLSTNDYDNSEKSKVASASQDVTDIKAKIPSQATAQNQLADKDFVNSSIATATADFKGTYDSLSELQAVTADNNDYGYVVSTDEAGNTVYSRYKYNGSAWVFEYDLNNSSFTAAEWASIQSQITSALVQKLSALPTNQELSQSLSGKQDIIPDLSTIRSGANAGATAYQKPDSGIPASDMASGVVPEDVVKYASQTLTDSQKTQARTNIGAASEEELDAISRGEYVEAWDGVSEPVVAEIPSGVQVEYNSQTYTGTLAASNDTLGKIYLVSTGTSNEYNRYRTSRSGVEGSYTYSWVPFGSTQINLANYATETEVSQLQQEVSEQVELGLWGIGSMAPGPSSLPDYASTTRLRMVSQQTISKSGNYKIVCNSGYLFLIYVAGKINTATWTNSRTVSLDAGDIYRIAIKTEQDTDFSGYTQEQVDAVVSASGIGMFSGYIVQSMKKSLDQLDGMRVANSYGDADLKVTDENGYTVLKLEDGDIKTKNFNSKGMPSVEGYSADFAISDKNGKTILKLKNGEIRTKKFDSERLPVIDDSLADYEISDADDNVLFRIRRGHIVTANFDSEKTEENPMAGKKIVWYGTSIPAAGYPQICGQYLNATVHNEAVGGSMCRMGMPYATPDNPLGDVYGIAGLAFQVVCTSLSMKQEEKHDIFVNWTTARRQANLIAQGYTAEQVANVKGWGELLTGGPADIMDSSQDNYRKMSYGLSYNSSTDIEPGLGFIPGKVDKYLNEDSFPDLWVFDHGHNDDKDNPYTEIETIPTPFDDRHYFIGSVNFLINHILQYNPRARFLIIGHYDRDTTSVYHHINVTDAQIKLAAFWNAPIYKTWEYSFVTRSRVVTTNAYWDESGEWHDSGFDGTNGYAGVHYDGVPENIRQVDGVWVHDMSLLWVHMLDGLHPAQEEYKDFLGHSMAKYISSLIVNF